MFYVKTFCVKMSKLWEGGGVNRASDNVQICVFFMAEIWYVEFTHKYEIIQGVMLVTI